MIQFLFRRLVSVGVAALLLSPASFAYRTALSDEALREAYFLGQRNNETTAAFFNKYVKLLSIPARGPHIAEVEIYTPYAQVVEAARVRSVGYSAQQANRDYHNHSDSVFVRVRINFTGTYGALELYRTDRDSNRKSDDSAPPAKPDFYHDFRVGLSQKDQWIEPLSIQLQPAFDLGQGHFPFSPPSAPMAGTGGIYGSIGGAGNSSYAVGWLVWLEYDAKDVVSDDALVEVYTTDGQHVAVPFDLDRLR